MLPRPLEQRNGIPFYHIKTEAEFRADPYEDYSQMVTRQLDLHFGHEIYPWAPIDEWLLDNIDLKNSSEEVLVEAGCGLGRQIATIAMKYDRVQAIGFDFSYQMLKPAKSIYCDGKEVAWLSQRGFGEQSLPAEVPIKNIQFALANAQALPLSAESVDVLFSVFLFDRLAKPADVLNEWLRVIKKGGSLIIVSPLNFQQVDAWNAWYPIQKVIDHIIGMNFQLLTHDSVLIREPLDVKGNAISWTTECLQFFKW
ncbi:MAG: class I SAM-dependent methyltransferase [Bacteroidota bacterium]